MSCVLVFPVCNRLCAESSPAHPLNSGEGAGGGMKASRGCVRTAGSLGTHLPWAPSLPSTRPRAWSPQLPALAVLWSNGDAMSGRAEAEGLSGSPSTRQWPLGERSLLPWGVPANLSPLLSPGHQEKKTIQQHACHYPGNARHGHPGRALCSSKRVPCTQAWHSL